MVSTSSSSSASSPPPPPSNGATGSQPPDQIQSVHGLAGQRVQVNRVNQGGQLIKADFEIVSAPSGHQHPGQSQQHNHQHHANHQQHHHTSTYRPPVETTRLAGDSPFEDPQTTPAAPRPPSASVEQQDLGHQLNKPAVIHLDGNKVELPIKPAVGMHDLLPHQSGGTQTSGQPPPPPPPQHELDGNQIDLKLSKDYRSSGDQSIYGTTITVPSMGTESNQLGDAGQSSTNLIGQNSAVLLSNNQLWPVFVTLVTTTFIAIFHLSHSRRNQAIK